LKEYKKRKDFLCEELSSGLGQFFSFVKPNGGMAIWGEFSNDVCLKKLSQTAKNNHVLISDGFLYGNKNCLRLGFASLEPDEMKLAVSVLRNILLS